MTSIQVAAISTSAGMMLLTANTHQNRLQSQLSTTAIDKRMEPSPWQNDASVVVKDYYFNYKYSD